MTQPDDKDTTAGPFAEMLRLQSDFQVRMAEETLRYLRRMQGMFEPHAPGTVLQPEQPEPLLAQTHRGETCTLTLDVENRQRVHCVLSPSVTPLVAGDGTTWFPLAESRPTAHLLATDETVTVAVDLSVPDDVPDGEYRGLLVLRGVRPGGVPVVVTVAGHTPPAEATS